MKNLVACLLGLVVAQGKQDEFGAAVHPEDEQFKSFSISVPTPSETLQVAISKLSSHSFTMSKATAAAGLPDMTLQKLKNDIAEMPQVSRTITGEFLVDPSGAAIGVSIQHGKMVPLPKIQNFDKAMKAFTDQKFRMHIKPASAATDMQLQSDLLSLEMELGGHVAVGKSQLQELSLEKMSVAGGIASLGLVTGIVLVTWGIWKLAIGQQKSDDPAREMKVGTGMVIAGVVIVLIAGVGIPLATIPAEEEYRAEDMVDINRDAECRECRRRVSRGEVYTAPTAVNGTARRYTDQPCFDVC